ncbi:tripartite tricarboxylate transporter TctB family protein [Erwiniaceae bacterium BAC15a-03b]|uniref:Tripartite tricarboxylate transporter TctB family protein n=1 Tax=Winslowiella arboricola TaxID=2978220 RepID=A0A9J6PNN3_9GAMM|nr:tripartite tricarboxylate transporter TctB family protein [Winslowiella arboricola]MCU5772496.1 tripartite tricarboxylate transporter TctB family protein [Winslowiella arboricola]MCU5779018.1 tripartite tricarboxylate transporter TctB family protein [Winslowiella arboricola]
MARLNQSGRENALAGLFLAGWGTFYLFKAREYGVGDAMEPGSGYFPLLLGALLVLLAVLIILRALLCAPTAEQPAATRWPWRQIALIVAALVSFAVLIGGTGKILPFTGAGLFLATLVMSFIAGLANRDITLKENLLIAGCMSLLSWLVFIKMLHLYLPLWPWS